MEFLQKEDSYSAHCCRQNSKRFSVEQFKNLLQIQIEEIVQASKNVDSEPQSYIGARCS